GIRAGGQATQNSDAARAGPEAVIALTFQPDPSMGADQMGGFVPLGYRVENRKLVIEESEAATVRMIFERFVAIGSATVLAKTLAAENVRTRRGKPIDKGFLYKLLNNRVYIGEAVHKGTSYPGEHEAIIDRALWDKVHTILQTSPRQRAGNTRSQTPALLKGLIFTDTGSAMTPTATRKGS